jgi:TRAP-type C4-dicarboxylate transport system permease small subunit
MGNHSTMNWPRIMRGAIERVGDVLAVIAGIALALTMLTMAADAIGRKVSGPLPGGYETSMALMVLVMLLPQAFAERKKAHISVDLVTQLLPTKARNLLQAIGALLGLGAFVLIACLGTEKAWLSTRVGESWPGIVNYPVWPFRWMVPLGSALLALQFLLTAVDRLNTGRGE